ncbi:MAG: hypothetical protein Q7R77_00030 [Candidatus Daviesbacteria bacterium]|nr:hypothetical protein [Candidatus Daviesbacteria bacterium]
MTYPQNPASGSLSFDQQPALSLEASRRVIGTEGARTTLSSIQQQASEAIGESQQK